ncbi:MAG TPA: universal stress protein [Armatimonadota bacterium]|jgi:hypothetical protein
MLRNLAVGIDTGPGAGVPLRQAVELAVACSARLHLLHALDEPGRGDDDLLESPGDLVLRALQPSDQPDDDPPSLTIPPDVERARQLCHEAGVPSRIHLYRGAPWPWMAWKALLAQTLMVGRSSLRNSGTARWGRNLTRLLESPQTPVWICAREVTEMRRALVLYESSPAGARALTLTAEVCAGLNLPLTVLAVARRRGVAAYDLHNVRSMLYAYHLECTFSAAQGDPAAVLLEEALEHHPSLVALPAPPSRWGGSLLRHPLCRAALQAPDAATLIVP